VSAYAYRAVDPSGRIVRGELAALSEADLDHRLAQISLQLLRCRRLHDSRGGRGGSRVNRRELINFCFHLGQAHRAGLPILEALADLRDSTEHAAFRNTLAALCLAVESGQSLSQAMSDFPATFDSVFVNLIRAGEQSGELSQVLAKMTETLKWQDELSSQTRKLLMYPAFVGTVVTGVVFFLMLYVVPELTEFLKNMGQEMPLHTRVLIAISGFMMAWWPALLALPVGLVLAGRVILVRSPRARRAFDAFKLGAWIIGPILGKIVMSRFITYFQIMYASGITVVDALRTSRDLAGNAVVAEALEKVSQFVEQGNSLSAGIEKAGLFPPLVVRMVRMGEDIGQLEESLLNVTYFYNREVEESVGRLQSMVEPAMTVILGLILGWVMMSVLGPIYETIGNIGVG
jgi:type IV pilus assembly protein PilC